MGKIAGMALLAMIIGLCYCVKYDLLPAPKAQTVEVSGNYIKGVFHEFTVPEEAVVEEQGHAYIYILQAKTSYWLDGLYAIKIPIKVLDHERSIVSVAFNQPEAVPPGVIKVVLHPLPSYSDHQKVRET